MELGQKLMDTRTSLLDLAEFQSHLLAASLVIVHPLELCCKRIRGREEGGVLFQETIHILKWRALQQVNEVCDLDHLASIRGRLGRKLALGEEISTGVRIT